MPRIDASALDAHLAAAVDVGAVPGIALVVSTRDGVAYGCAAGRLRADDPDAPAVTGDTLFRWASLTKALTSVAALQLVEQVRLRLDTQVERILPEFAELQVLDGWDGDTPRLRAPRRAPTIQDLMTHTSGLGYFFANSDLQRWHELAGTPTVLTGRKAALHAPLVHDPGTHFEYGVSTDWLGLVIERIVGSPLDEVIDEWIFTPLGMHDATFRPTDEQKQRMMAVHERTPEGGLGLSSIDLPADPEFVSGGGGAYGSARDHSRFLRALLRGGELDGVRILDEKTTELLFTDHIGGIPQHDVMCSAVPELTNDVPALPVETGWGLGLALRNERIPGMREAGSANWGGLYNCYFWIDRASGISASLLTQVLPFFDQKVLVAAIALEMELYAEAATPA